VTLRRDGGCVAVVLLFFVIAAVEPQSLIEGNHGCNGLNFTEFSKKFAFFLKL